MTLPGFGKHCSDESLTALLDGELSDRQKRKVRRHLEVCWHCRARQSELQAGMHELARALEGQHFLTPERLDSAWKRLQSRMQGEAPNRKTSRWWRFSFQSATAAAVTALLILGTVASRRAPRRTLPPQVAIRPVPAPDQAQDSTHQQVVVELRKLGPVTEELRGTLDVWCAGSSPHRSFRWRGERGEIRWGLWQKTGSLAERRSIPELRPAVARRTHLGDLAANWSDLRDGEYRWTEWLAHRDRGPLELFAEWLRLLRDDGFRLRARKVAGSVVLLSADKLAAGHHLEAWLEVDSAGTHARLLGLRWETPRGAWQIVLRIAKEERISPDRIPADVFIPVSFPSVRSAPPAPRAFIAPERSWDEDTEIDALDALHLQGACLGEPVFLQHDRNGRWSVHGVVRDEQRKRALEDTLASIRGLSVEIRSMAETAAAAIPSGEPPEQKVEPELVAAAESPVERQLRAHFGSATAIAEFCRAQVNDADRALEEAWAIRRLDERFEGRASLMSPRAHLLLDRMRKDHEDALRACLGRLSAGLSGVFGIQTGLRDSNLDRFHRIERLTRVVHALFAGDKAAQADADALNELFTLLKTNTGRLAP